MEVILMPERKPSLCPRAIHVFQILPRSLKSCHDGLKNNTQSSSKARKPSKESNLDVVLMLIECSKGKHHLSQQSLNATYSHRFVYLTCYQTLHQTFPT